MLLSAEALEHMGIFQRTRPNKLIYSISNQQQLPLRGKYEKGEGTNDTVTIGKVSSKATRSTAQGPISRNLPRRTSALNRCPWLSKTYDKGHSAVIIHKKLKERKMFTLWRRMKSIATAYIENGSN